MKNIRSRVVRVALRRNRERVADIMQKGQDIYSNAEYVDVVRTGCGAARSVCWRVLGCALTHAPWLCAAPRRATSSCSCAPEAP
jgi:hypothetical protein